MWARRLIGDSSRGWMAQVAAQQADEADGRLRRPQLIGEALGSSGAQRLSMTALDQSTYARSFGAVLCGVTAGPLMTMSMQAGLQIALRSVEDYRTWSLLFWGEHWVVRGLVSLLGTFAAAMLTGVVARRHGRGLAVAALFPTFLVWAYMGVAAWSGRAPFLPDHFTVETSLGNKLMAAAVALFTLPVAAAAGEQGEAIGETQGPHFDTRNHTLLGVAWYHLLWIPVVIHGILADATFAVLYGLQWVIRVWQAGRSFAAIIPVLFMMGVLGSLLVAGSGATNAYRLLAGLDDYPSAARFLTVLKFAVGYPIVAFMIQGIILLVHLGLTKVLQ